MEETNRVGLKSQRNRRATYLASFVFQRLKESHMAQVNAVEIPDGQRAPPAAIGKRRLPRYLKNSHSGSEPSFTDGKGRFWAA
jgi:hypothetical protein